MMGGTSPSITTLSSGGFQVAFEANTTSLWTVGSAGNKDWNLGMMPGTSPSIVGAAARRLPGRVRGQHHRACGPSGSAGNKDWSLGMMPGTSPRIAALAGGGFEVAFEANTTNLWTVGDAGDTGTGASA